MRWILVLLLAGCAKTSEVIPVTAGAFEVTADAHDLASARNAACAAAVRYCATYRIEASVIRFDDHNEALAAASTLMFRCVAPEH